MSERMMAYYTWPGNVEQRRIDYNRVLEHVVAVSPARPVIHLAWATPDAFHVVDVWDNEQILHSMVDNPKFREKLDEHGLGDADIDIVPLHNLGWPISASPMYR